MNSQTGNVDFSALLELAEARYLAWLGKENLPELQRRLCEVRQRYSNSRGRASANMEIRKEFLAIAIRKRVGFYAELAREPWNPEMLSKVCLEQYRGRILADVKAAALSWRDNAAQDARTSGDYPVLPICNQELNPERNAELNAELDMMFCDSLLRVLNDELRVLEAEGKVAPRSVASPARLPMADGSEIRPPAGGRPIDAGAKEDAEVKDVSAEQALCADESNPKTSSEVRQLSIPSPATGDPTRDSEKMDSASFPSEPKSEAQKRRAAVDDFVARCQQAANDLLTEGRLEKPLKITRSHIWRSAKHKRPRHFQYWQADHPKATARDRQNFARVLNQDPRQFVLALIGSPAPPRAQ
jgi:hypothetical protein